MCSGSERDRSSCSSHVPKVKKRHTSSIISAAGDEGGGSGGRIHCHVTDFHSNKTSLEKHQDITRDKSQTKEILR